ncbi:helix-turn-helix transcriptional regulator [Actinokineospora auranticolor]|uniref:Helix-turn-helix protein n=1 Tax=Actinokineospora auranticolor TaxID=155976 RepID=A0A2S6GKY3_9PSEU|nr:helix-turn-helix transcriptional regulator [Actinokineospora auranticolor]PPK65843.1 helix-turn-helix protein [Actinokineospora auranticolor]
MSDALATNLSRLRKANDLSQEALSVAADVSVDTVGRIERGERQTTRPGTIDKLAAALGVSSDALQGRLATLNGSDADITSLRRAITPTGDVPGLTEFTETDEVVCARALAVEAHKAWRAYVDGRHDELLQRLPALLTDARRLIHASSGAEKATACRLISVGYRLGAGIAGRLGLDDLAWTAAEKAIDVARQSDTPEVDTAVSTRYLVWTLIRQGRTAEAERVAVVAAERIEPRMLDRDPTRAGVFGNLLFNAANAAHRSGSAQRAEDLLAVAAAAAIRAGVDSASEVAIFGPRVAALQRVDHTIRHGDPERGLSLARRLPDAQGVVPRFWESGHRLHLASAAVKLKKPRLALGYLGQARELSPDWARRQPLGRSVMRKLVDDATRRQGSQFAGLAAHYGVA